MSEDYRVPVSDEIKDTLRDMGRTIGKALPKGWGFTLLIYTFGEGGTMTYISNAQREDMLKAMQEFLQKQGA
jgi:predicted hydrocarbon binding protein